ncbi:hypothetical protein [Inconstantimicrobium mannanitabidum]|uniref:Uncharacterized protein n=1 Tax=Inconstantimicrobium mannanitabidum TaxID=1604901 RepID=A0ACB5RAX0_9CLOT|nr:hypothetical protein [Clostridium sp. TW13]GKX66186.1 hypothetical protein rsdtw13_14440 [Clostridium sp. TW13]
MKKVKLAIAFLWQGIIAFISPLWIGLIYMDITGHGKGYDYDLGSEVDIYIVEGIIALILWSIAILPVTMWLGLEFYEIKKRLATIPLLSFIILFVIGIAFIGLKNFLSAFGIR